MDWSWCAFKWVTGIDCPGCGLTRSIITLFKGDVLSSIEWHPMGIVFAVGLLGGWWWRSFPFSPSGKKWISHAILFGFLVPWVIRFLV